MSNKNLNGSVNMLADAMRKVFVESMDSNRMAMKEDLNAVRDDLTQQNKTTNENMQAQFASQEKKIDSLLGT